MEPSETFNLLAMGRVMGESRISKGDAAMDRARRRIVNKDAAGNMAYWKVMPYSVAPTIYVPANANVGHLGHVWNDPPRKVMTRQLWSESHECKDSASRRNVTSVFF
jgi:hypothetical protein